MIEIRYKESPQEIKLSASGHAEREEDGTAYACSKVSIITQALALSVLDLSEKKERRGIEYMASHGEFFISANLKAFVPEERAQIKAYFTLCMGGLEIVKQQFEKSVFIAWE